MFEVSALLHDSTKEVKSQCSFLANGVSFKMSCAVFAASFTICSPGEHPFPVVVWTDAVGRKHRTKSGTEGNMLEELHRAAANTHR